MIANLRQLLRRRESLTSQRAHRRKLAIESVEALEARQLMAGGLTVTGTYNASAQTGSQEEISIAVNPTNTQNVVIVSNTTTSALFYGVSFDGGVNFTRQNIATASDFTAACCDGSVMFDQFGNLFITYLDSAIATAPVLVSTDGGKSLKQAFAVPGVSDQPKLAVGPGGSVAASSVWVEYLDNSGKIGAVGAPVTGLGTVGAPTAPQLVNGAIGNFGKPGVGPNGQLLVSFQVPSGGAGPSEIYTALDPDGLGPLGFNPATKVTDLNIGGFTPIPAQPARTVDSEVEVRYDNSGGPRNGRAYLALLDSPAIGSPDTNVFLIYSDDDGKTWSPRVRVNDDTGTNSQFLNRMAVDQSSGNVAISFYDSRNDTGSGAADTDGKANTDAEFFVTASVDGGKTFLPNTVVSKGPSNASAVGGNNNGGFDFGDYTGLDFAKGVIYPAWADNSVELGEQPGPAEPGRGHGAGDTHAPERLGRAVQRGRGHAVQRGGGDVQADGAGDAPPRRSPRRSTGGTAWSRRAWCRWSTACTGSRGSTPTPRGGATRSW